MRNFVIAAVKRVWSIYDPRRKAVLDAVRSEHFPLKQDGTPSLKKAVTYQCAACKKPYPSAGVQVDHKKPIGKQPPWPPTGDGSWDRYIAKIFCELDNLQVLCKPCHKAKSKQEKSEGAYE